MEMTSIMNIFNGLENLLPVLCLVVAAVGMCALLLVASIKASAFWWLHKRRMGFIEITPAASLDSEPDIEKLFAAFYGLNQARSLSDKLLLRPVVFSFEILSLKNKGIRYILCVREEDEAAAERAILACLPGAKLTRATGNGDDTNSQSAQRVLTFRQTGHFAYPLQGNTESNDHDSVSYLTNAMTKLANGEFMAVQFVLSPARVREAEILAYRLLRNEELVYGLGRQGSPLLRALMRLVGAILFGITDTVGEIASGVPTRRSGADPHTLHQQQVAMHIKPARVLGPLEQQLAMNVHNKLTKPLFRTDIRVITSLGSDERRKDRVKAIRDWLALFTVPSYQSLIPRPDWPWTRTYRAFLSERRLPAFVQKHSLLSTTELAELYHFPHGQQATAENVVRSLSKTLPAPVSLKDGRAFDVILGRNHHHGSETDIGLTAHERERHVFVVGGTGSGKTTMLKYAIVQDIQSGKGVAVLDPHGDLAQELLAQIPEHRLKDVIYFNPADLSYPIGLNLLEIPEGLEGDELLDAKDFIAETVVSIMRKTFSEDGTGGHRIEYVLRNAVHTALTVEGATLFTVYDLLMDEKYRKPIVNALTTPWLKNFWKYEFGKAGDFQQIKMMAGVTAKIGRFHASVSADRILSQSKSTIDFDDILNGKILICNLAKGLIGEDTSEVLGISVLAKLQLAAYRRIKVQQGERRPFYAYVDEFQNFATVSFVQMLSESRKYKLYLTMAEQTVSQQDDQKMVNIIMANVGTIVCFRSSSPADEAQLLPLFSPYIESGEIANVPAFSFFARLGGGLEAQEPLSGRTLLTSAGDSQMPQRVIASSREIYARKFVAPAQTAPKNNARSNKHRNKQVSSLPEPASAASQSSVLPIGSEL